MGPKYDFNVIAILYQSTYWWNEITITSNQCNCVNVFVCDRVSILYHSRYNTSINFFLLISYIPVFDNYLKSRSFSDFPKRIIRWRAASKKHTALYFTWIVACYEMMKSSKIDLVARPC